eukprot:scaffold1690_cov366-Prasinococcus_capsulatus_cf.AAC.7
MISHLEDNHLHHRGSAPQSPAGQAAAFLHYIVRTRQGRIARNPCAPLNAQIVEANESPVVAFARARTVQALLEDFAAEEALSAGAQDPRAPQTLKSRVLVHVQGTVRRRGCEQRGEQQQDRQPSPPRQPPQAQLLYSATCRRGEGEAGRPRTPGCQEPLRAPWDERVDQQRSSSLCEWSGPTALTARQLGARGHSPKWGNPSRAQQPSWPACRHLAVAGVWESGGERENECGPHDHVEPTPPWQRTGTPPTGRSYAARENNKCGKRLPAGRLEALRTHPPLLSLRTAGPPGRN